MIEIGALQFTSKKAAKTYFGEMLRRHNPRTPIPEPDASELAALLQRHHESKEKIGSGIDHFEVRLNPPYNTFGFHVVRTDGTATDFSYLKCVDGAPSPLAEAKRAMREEVRDDILQAKRAYFAEHADADGRIRCVATGAPISIEQADADHVAPWYFDVLATSFIRARGIDLTGFVTPAADNQYVPRIADRVLAGEWREFHHELAGLRIISRAENCARSQDARLNPGECQILLRRG